jgi:DNA repair exonuclease SbcCD ATPase subunit
LAALTKQQYQEFQSLEAHYKTTVAELIENLYIVKDKIALYYEKQHEAINENLGKYQAVVTTVGNLEQAIRQVDFPEKFVSLDTHIVKIYAEIQQDIAELQAVKQHHDDHLAAVQAAHQYFLQQLTAQAEEKLQATIQQFTVQSQGLVQNLQTAQQHFEQQTTNQKNATQQLFDEITTQHQALYTQTIKTSTAIQEYIEQQIKGMLQAFEQQQTALTTFVARYEKLVQYTYAVEQKITELNFPQKLALIAEQLANLEQTVEEKLGVFKSEVSRYWNDLDSKIATFKKQTEGHLQAVEGHELLLQTQIEQLQRHLQQQIQESSSEEILLLKEQNEFLNTQLKNQNQQLFYLLMAVLGIGLVIILQTILIVIK